MQVIRGLGEFDPDRRTPSASLAREQLAATGLLDGADPLEVLGEIEVFDQLPPLPEGWSDDGPVAPTVTPSASAPPVSMPPAATSQSVNPAATTPQSPPTERRGLWLAVLLMVGGALVLLLAAYLAWG